MPSYLGVTPRACSACTASAVELESSPVKADRSVAGHGLDRSERYAVQPPSGHCWLTSQVIAAESCTPATCSASRPSDWRKAPSYVGSLAPNRATSAVFVVVTLAAAVSAGGSTPTTASAAAHVREDKRILRVPSGVASSRPVRRRRRR